MQIGKYNILENEIIATNPKCLIVKAEDPNNPKSQLCAKITQLSKDQDQTIINNQNRELEVLQILIKIEEKNIMKIYDFKDVFDKRYIIMERCQMSLTTYIEKIKKNKLNFTLIDLLDLIKQVSDGCKVLQSKQILHRDVKSDNILVNLNSNSQPTYKISDFDISIQVNQKLQTFNQQGTPSIKAPEIIDSKYSVQADVFSFGLTLCQIIFGDIKQSQVREFKDSLKKNKYLLGIKQSKDQDDQKLFQQLRFNLLHNTVLIFLNKMLAYDPKDRFDWNNLSNECFKLISNKQLMIQHQATILLIVAEPQKFPQKQQLRQVNQPNHIQNPGFQNNQFQNQIQNKQQEFTKVDQNHYQQKLKFDPTICQNNNQVPHSFHQRQQQQQFPQQQLKNPNQKIPFVKQEGYNQNLNQVQNLQQNQPTKINQNCFEQGQPQNLTKNQFQPPNNQMTYNRSESNFKQVNQQFAPPQQGTPTKVQYQTIAGNGYNFQQQFQNKVPFNTKFY